MKLFFILMMLFSQLALAESSCDIKLGSSVGVRVIEFSTGNTIHSKMALKEMSVYSLREEMTNLQDMGICDQNIQRKRCILKFEKSPVGNKITMFRSTDRWLSWGLAGKDSAKKFVKILQQAGYCV
jgi:hypothetical protein